MRGTVNLTGCNLVGALNFPAAWSNQFVIVQNDGVDPIVGTFNLLPEGDLLTIGRTKFQITYAGGSGGNDVVLTAVAFAATGVTSTWDGGGADNFWSNATNWAGDTLPNSGDHLLFPLGAPRRNSQNDFSGDTVFGRVTLGDTYTFSGNPLGVFGGIYATQASGGTVAFDLPLQFLRPQTLVATEAGAFLSFGGPVTQSGFLTNSGLGTVTFAQPVSGEGGFQATSGTLRLLASNILTGEVLVTGAAQLVVNGTLPVPITLRTGSLLGSGEVGPVTLDGGGSLIPGDASTAARLHLNGGLTVVSNTAGARNIYFNLNGPTPGVDYDQLQVTGPVDFTNLTVNLQLNFGFTPAIGDAFTLISNDGTDAILGQFAGLSQNGLLTNGLAYYRLSYTGGDGNDLTLTRVPLDGPSLITSAAVVTNSFQLSGLGVASAPYVLKASTNFVNWSALQTNTSDGAGIYQFIDQDFGHFPVRFYRVQSP